jgi:hypothetical protein
MSVLNYRIDQCLKADGLCIYSPVLVKRQSGTERKRLRHKFLTIALSIVDKYEITILKLTLSVL